MWQASAAWWPNTTSSTTGLRVRTASKYVARCGDSSSQSGPLNAIVSGIGTWPSAGSLSWCHLATYASCNALRSEEHTSELQSRLHLVCRLLLEKKKTTTKICDQVAHQRTT